MSEMPSIEATRGARINGLLESVETGRTSTQGGADKVAVIARAQYLTQELARRTQDRQTRWIIAMTALITVMTLAIMVATIPWLDWLRAADSLWIRASQVIDLWWPRG
jgi:hypothetical protein